MGLTVGCGKGLADCGKKTDVQMHGHRERSHPDDTLATITSTIQTTPNSNDVYLQRPSDGLIREGFAPIFQYNPNGNALHIL
eukprot:4850334-Amphidinium_carterae.1